MKKTLSALIALFLLIILSPILPILAIKFISDLNGNGISGNFIQGFNFESLQYKQLKLDNVKAKFSAISIKSAEIIQQKFSDIKVIPQGNSFKITAKFYQANISGILKLKSNKQVFSGTWQKSPYQNQSILFNNNQGNLKIISNGDLGELSLTKEAVNQKLKLDLQNFNIGVLLNKPNTKNLINAKGDIELKDNLTGNITFKDTLNNQLILAFSKPKINFNMNLEQASFWLGPKIDTIQAKGTITEDGKPKDLEAQIKLKDQINLKLNLFDNELRAKLYIQDNLINFKSNSALTIEPEQFRQIIEALSNRFANNHTEAEIKSNLKTINFEVSSNSRLINGKILGLVAINPKLPKQTTIKAISNNLELNLNNNNFKLKNITFDSNPANTNIRATGHFNNQAFSVTASQADNWQIHLNGSELTIPISHNTSLIISPNLSVNHQNNIFYVSGSADIHGGFIHTDNHDHVVDLPENVIILGEQNKVKFFDSMLNNLQGSIILNTSEPIKAENLAGLSGIISGRLKLSLSPGITPKFDGFVRLSQPKYLKNKHVKVAIAEATYENNEINNPVLNIKLTRAISQPSFDLSSLATINKIQKVGVIVNGTVDQPYIRTFSTNPDLTKLQIISALETGSTNSISPEQGVLSLFSIFDGKKTSSPLESIQDALSLDEIYFASNSAKDNDKNNLINPNLGDASIVITKTLLENIKASYIASLHSKDYLINITYPLSESLNVNLYSSHTNQPNLSTNIDNYGINLLMYSAR